MKRFAILVTLPLLVLGCSKPAEPVAPAAKAVVHKTAIEWTRKAHRNLGRASRYVGIRP